MEEVYPGIFMITEKRLMTFVTPPSNVYVITGSDGMIFDGGYGTGKPLNYFFKKYREIESSFIYIIYSFTFVYRVPDHYLYFILIPLKS